MLFLSFFLKNGEGVRANVDADWRDPVEKEMLMVRERKENR